jgi:hypothetical protein
MSREIIESFVPPRATVATNAGFQALQGRWLRLAYSHSVLVHTGPCVQTERISFASRYSFGYNIKPCQLFLRLTDRLSRYGQAMAAHPLTDFSGVYRHGVTRDPIGQGYRVAPRHGAVAAGGAVVG